MNPFVIGLLVVVVIVLAAVQQYFWFGPGRTATIGNADHWWNKKTTGNARRLIGAIIALAGAVLLVVDLTRHQHYGTVYGGPPLDIVIIVLGVLVAAKILPRNRRA